MTLPLIIVGDLLDAAMVVVGVPRQEARVLLVGDQQAEPHHQVDHDEDVVCVGQQVPRDWDALGRKQRFKREKSRTLNPPSGSTWDTPREEHCRGKREEVHEFVRSAQRPKS